MTNLKTTSLILQINFSNTVKSLLLKRLILFFSLISLLYSCSNEQKAFYPDPFIFEIGTPKDSVICFVEDMSKNSPEKNPVRMESMKGGAIKIYNVYNHENSNSWALYSLYLYFDTKNQVSDILILDIYDQANVFVIEKWNQEYFQHIDLNEEKSGLKKHLAPRWCVRHNDQNEYIMSYVRMGVDGGNSLAPCADYAFAKTYKTNAVNRLSKHKQSEKPDYFGIPVNRSGDKVGELIP